MKLLSVYWFFGSVLTEGAFNLQQHEENDPWTVSSTLPDYYDSDVPPVVRRTSNIISTSFHSKNGFNCSLNMIGILLQHECFKNAIWRSDRIIRTSSTDPSNKWRNHLDNFVTADKHLEFLDPIEETLLPALTVHLRKWLTYYPGVLWGVLSTTKSWFNEDASVWEPSARLVVALLKDDDCSAEDVIMARVVPSVEWKEILVIDRRYCTVDIWCALLDVRTAYPRSLINLSGILSVDLPCRGPGGKLM